MNDSGSDPQPLVNRIDAEKAVVVGQAGTVNFSMGDQREKIPVHDPPRNLPPRQPTFAGRKRELQELHERLSASSAVGITQQAAIHGHGGLGKTSLAVEYGWEFRDAYPGGVFFLPCEAVRGVPPLEELAPHLGLAPSETASETAMRVRAHLETKGPCLLILDNVRGPEQVREWTPSLPGGGCRRLLTTRADRLPEVEMMHLERLSPEDGLALLANYRPDVCQAEDAAGEVVDWFDGLAVGLTVVGVYMQMLPALPWARYAASLREKGLDSVRGAEKVVAGREGGIPRYAARVDAVFDDLLDALPAAERRALEYAALLPADNVYLPWLVDLLQRDGVDLPALPGFEDAAAESVVQTLISRQLLRSRGEDTGVVGLHRVLRERVQERLRGAGEFEPLLDRVAELAERRGERSREALTDVSVRAELTPLIALSRSLNHMGRLEGAVSLANWLSAPLTALGRFGEGRDLLGGYGSASYEELVGAQAYAILCSNLALILQDLGELKEARARMERAIEAGEQHFAADHPTLATRYSNLAMILQDLGELKEARARMERAIEIDEQHFAADHPALAISYLNLAVILHTSGDTQRACEHLGRARSIAQKHFADDHRLVQAILSRIGAICSKPA